MIRWQMAFFSPAKIQTMRLYIPLPTSQHSIDGSIGFLGFSTLILFQYFHSSFKSLLQPLTGGNILITFVRFRLPLPTLPLHFLFYLFIHQYPICSCVHWTLSCTTLNVNGTKWETSYPPVKCAFFSHPAYCLLLYQKTVLQLKHFNVILIR